MAYRAEKIEENQKREKINRDKKGEKQMKILIVEPNKEPYESFLDNKLKAMQRIVDGYIEVVKLDKDTALVCNEEGKLIGLEGNRRVNQDVIAGTFFIVGDNNEGEFISLTEEQISKYQEKFKEPEAISSEEVEDSIYMEFCALDEGEWEAEQ